MVLHDIGELYWLPHCRDYKDKFGAWCYNRVNTVLRGLMKNILGRVVLKERIVERLYNYVAENVKYSEAIHFDYPRFPLESLTYGIGDCEDKSTALAALLKIAGFRVALAYINDEKRDFCHAFCFLDGGRWIKDKSKLWDLYRYPELGHRWLLLDPTYSHCLRESPKWIKRYSHLERIPFIYYIILEYRRVRGRGYRVGY